MQRLAGILMVPITTRCLTPADYGMAEARVLVFYGCGNTLVIEPACANKSGSGGLD